jgi:hypothetical protein
MLFKNSVRTAKRTQIVTITEISWLMLFIEIIAEKYTNHTNTKCKSYLSLNEVNIISTDKIQSKQLNKIRIVRKTLLLYFLFCYIKHVICAVLSSSHGNIKRTWR